MSSDNHLRSLLPTGLLIHFALPDTPFSLYYLIYSRKLAPRSNQPIVTCLMISVKSQLMNKWNNTSSFVDSLKLLNCLEAVADYVWNCFGLSLLCKHKLDYYFLRDFSLVSLVDSRISVFPFFLQKVIIRVIEHERFAQLVWHYKLGYDVWLSPSCRMRSD